MMIDFTLKINKGSVYSSKTCHNVTAFLIIC